MNRKQKVAIVIGVLAAVVAVVFPPMDVQIDRTASEGPPPPTGELAKHPITVDVGLLGLILLIVFALTIAAVVVLRTRKA